MHFVKMCIFFLNSNIKKGDGSVCDSSYYQIEICKKDVKWYFCILALGFCSGLSHATYGWLSFWFIACFVFSFSLKCVQFLEEELSLSHLHMLSHSYFCPGGLPCWFSPPDTIIWFAAASAPYFDSCGSVVFACGCFPRGWCRHCCPTLQLGVKPKEKSSFAPLSFCSDVLRGVHGSLR